jgi:hypothetical protein
MKLVKQSLKSVMMVPVLLTSAKELDRTWSIRENELFWIRVAFV